MYCLRKSLKARPFRTLLVCIVALAAGLLIRGDAHGGDVPPNLQAAYKEYSGFVQPGNLRATVTALSAFGSRVAGYPGDTKAADYVIGRFNTLLGGQNVKVDTFPVTVPFDPQVENANLGAMAQLTAPGSPKLQMYPLWPNLVRTSTLPVNGLTAPVIYVGNGKLRNFNGKDVEGSVVMVDFNSGSEWLNAPRLGAKAVIFVAPDTTMRGEAEAKFISIPISIPRFWMTRAQAAPLMAQCQSGRPPVVKLTCNMPWQTRKARNVAGFLTGSDPVMRDQVIVVQSYYDSNSVVPALAPGADTSCGMAAMLEMMRTFKAHPPKRSMMFVATSAHFQALQGIREFIHQHMEEWMPAGWFEAQRPHKNIYFWAGLDLTSQTRSLGIFYKGWFFDAREDIQSRFSDIARVCRENSDQIGATLGFNAKRYFNDGINPVDGKDWRNYIPGKPAFDSEVATMSGGNAVTFASTDDSRSLVDTPFDTVDHVNIANLAAQVKLLNCLMYHVVTDSNSQTDTSKQRMPIQDPSKWSRMALQGGFSTVQGRVQMFNPRKSFIANSDPRLADSLVVVRNRTKSFMGVRGNMIQATLWAPPERMAKLDTDAQFRPLHTDPVTDFATARSGEQIAFENFFAFHGVPPLTVFGNGKAVTMQAYHLDGAPYRLDPKDPAGRTRLLDASGRPQPNENFGEIDYAPDLGTSGAKYVPLEIQVTTVTKETPIILFRCVPTAIYDLVDQQSLRALTGLTLYDGGSNGEPRMYGYAIDPQDPTLAGSYVEDVAVLFSQPGSRLKIAMDSGPGATRLLLINSQKGFEEGKGYLVAGNPKQAQNAELMGALQEEPYDPTQEIARGGAIYDTALHVAQDMWKLDDYRMRRLAKYRILDMKSNEGVPGLHQLAKASIDAALIDKEHKDWERFDADSRAAWGLESRAYPDVQQTAVDVVQGVLFYLALLMPFAYFCERLMFGFYDLKRQLSVAAVIFLAIFMCFRYIHPAFDITMNPVIVLLAFVMLALSSIVIGLISNKFESQLKEMNESSGGVHKADIGRVSVAMAAFNLGVSNMRRRKARTWLTCVTLVLLTFTVLSFTSVVQVMRFNKVKAPNDHGPRYNGIMIRTAMWDQLQEPAFRLLSDEYGREHSVAPRAWFFGTRMGEQSFLTLRRADRSFEAKALLGLSPAEMKVSRPQEALEPGGRWFTADDVYSVILPDTVAQALRIDSADVGKAKVTFSGTEYTVIGILNSQKMKSLTDLDNEPLTPVDFVAMNKQAGKSNDSSSQGFKEYTHLEPDSIFILPYTTATDLGAELRSIAIDFGDAKTVTQRLSPLMHRLGLNLYAGKVLHPEIVNSPARGTIERYSSIAATSSRGMELVFFPIIIASLIVLNTMLGSVYERISEIHIFSSIGLAPAHIGMLFIAEAMVYAILGSVAGYLLGQFTSKILVWTGWLPDLYLNFSSVSAVLTTLIVVAVVLLSTIYPARKAAEVASPAMDRTWRVPDPDGDNWAIPLPFAVTGDQAPALNSFLCEWLGAYEEYSIGEFVTQNVGSEEFVHPNGGAYRVTSMAWLAPFDLGVSQHISIETTPTNTEGVFDIRILIRRESGDISNWKRVNRRFLNVLRKQFLIWRTLKQGERDKYLRADEVVSGPIAPMSLPGVDPAV